MKETNRETTLLDLVMAVQDSVRTDSEVVAVIAHMIRTRRVVLSGIFARTPPPPSAA
jgi:hypothetical protein